MGCRFEVMVWMLPYQLILIDDTYEVLRTCIQKEGGVLVAAADNPTSRPDNGLGRGRVQG